MACGNVTVIHCTYDPASKGGESPDGRKGVKGTIQWVEASPRRGRGSAPLRQSLHYREHGRHPGRQGLEEYLNPNSMTVKQVAKLEPSPEFQMEDRYQFMHPGTSVRDSRDSKPGLPRIQLVRWTSKDSYASAALQNKFCLIWYKIIEDSARRSLVLHNVGVSRQIPESSRNLDVKKVFSFRSFHRPADIMVYSGRLKSSR